MVVTLGLPTDSQGKILRHVDANGVIWFTNLPTPRDEPGGMRTGTGMTRHDQSQRLRSHPYYTAIEQIARQHDVSPHLVNALMAVESGFNPEALSPKGAKGLMQLMPLITQYYRVYNPFDPQENIAGGVRFLSDLLKIFDHQLPHALAAYNGGEGLVRQHGGVPPFLESYVNKVMTLYAQLRGTSIHRYLLPSGTILLSNVPLSQEQLRQWEANK
jgi:soluble lytic murein transglycosylase-like protein